MFKQENRKKRIEKRAAGIEFYLFVLFSIFFAPFSYSQCAMCRAALTSEGNAVKAQAVNDGIVYLMVIPYVLVAGIGFYIYRMRRKSKQ